MNTKKEKKNDFEKRVQKVLNSIMEISMGNLDEEVPVEGSDEIAQIAIAVNDMRIAMKSLLEDIEQRKAREEEEKKKYLKQKISSILEVLAHITEGDLKSITEIKIEESDDEIIANLKQGINIMLKNLRETVMKLKGVTNEIISSSTEMNATAEEIVVKAKEELKLTEEASITITELNATSKQILTNAEEVVSHSTNTLKLVETNKEKLISITKEALQSNELLKKTSSQLLELGKKTEMISNIFQTIKKIADKSDLLALNAAIEAAGIGNIGRRFRVVADEMRRFANTTIEFSQQIESVLSNLISEINSGIQLMDLTVDKITKMIEEIEKIGNTMPEIVETFNNTVQLMKEVSVSIKQQSDGITKMEEMIHLVNTAAKDTSAGISNTKYVMDRLLKISDELNKLVQNFQTE